VNEKKLRSESYVLRFNESSLADAQLQTDIDEPLSWAFHPLWDPDKPETNATAFSSKVIPMQVTLNPGDILYLPALWYHKVTQDVGNDEFSCSVNYWYDFEYQGSFFPMTNLIKSLSRKINEPTYFQQCF